METVGVSFKLPKAILAAAKVKESDLESLMKDTLAIDLYRLGKVSLGKAAEIAGVKTKWEMIQLLSKHEVWLDYSAEDAKQDWEALRELETA